MILFRIMARFNFSKFHKIAQSEIFCQNTWFAFFASEISNYRSISGPPVDQFSKSRWESIIIGSQAYRKAKKIEKSWIEHCKNGRYNKSIFPITLIIRTKNVFFAIKVWNQKLNAQFFYMFESVHRHTRKAPKSEKKTFDR